MCDEVVVITWEEQRVTQAVTLALQWVGIRDLVTAARVCRSWRAAASRVMHINLTTREEVLMCFGPDALDAGHPQVRRFIPFVCFL